MRLLVPLTVLALSSITACQSMPPDDHLEQPAGAPMEMGRYVVGLIHRGPTWTPESTPELEELQAAHLANIERLVETGELSLAGPFGDDTDLRGLFIFNVPTVEEAEALVQSDPAVRSGRLRVELHPWWGPAGLADLFATDDG